MYDAIGCTTTAAWPEELAATADLVVCLPPRKKKEEEGRRQKRERKRFELVRANRVCDANGDAQQIEVWREEMLGSKKVSLKTEIAHALSASFCHYVSNNFCCLFQRYKNLNDI